MATLQLFWTPDEMAHWLSALASRFELRFLILPRQPATEGIWRLPPLEATDVRTSSGLFLTSQSDVHGREVSRLSEVKQREWGWIGVRGGGIYDDPEHLLEMTVIAVESARDDLKLKGCLVWLKKQLEKSDEFSRGLEISWTHRPGVHREDTKVFLSRGARKLASKGVALVSARGMSMIRYSPVEQVGIPPVSWTPFEA